MARIWPFGKKPTEPRQVKQPKKRKIVEYERKPDDSSGEMMADRSHLEDAAFKDAMALLGDDSKKQ
ncbi:MAG TPA: hypothetical protein EYQ15_00510 [Candidatus Poseidoniales archaeon]|nr:MAG: hypothetical protein CXT65_05445 [Euryarchaeota archaeon]HIG37788.1 hypothetical protein [Candidatus Poseidoniales archaeon]HIL43698.1 hypothetical protein [Candidatus Poseidoniales archaeon]